MTATEGRKFIGVFSSAQCFSSSDYFVSKQMMCISTCQKEIKLLPHRASLSNRYCSYKLYFGKFIQKIYYLNLCIYLTACTKKGGFLKAICIDIKNLDLYLE